MDVATLVVLAGNALVTAAMTDAWEDIKHQVARLFGRGQADPKIEQRLEATRAALGAATPAKLDAVRAHEAALLRSRPGRGRPTARTTEGFGARAPPAGVTPAPVAPLT